MSLSYSKRAQSALNQAGRTLLELMDHKQTNLSVAADVTTEAELLALAEQVGSEICLLKTHIDILEDFTPDTPFRLQEVAEKHNFLLFEDRKFADIGNTVLSQYGGGIYHIADWAHITNAHTVPGPGIIEGLKKIGLPKGRGLLLLAEMSAKGTLAQGSYTQQTVEWALEHEEFVMGFICRRKLTDAPAQIHMIPGVKLQEGGDGLGQQYLTPQKAIGELGCDVIIVGRGIVQADDPAAVADHYRTVGWETYQERLRHHPSH